MKKTIISILTFFLCLPIFCVICFGAGDDTVRVGLYYSGSSSNDALLSANLENYQNTGSGYYFGYYDGNRQFVKLGETAATQLSMSKDVNLYIKDDGSYTTEAISGAQAIGCFHLQLNQVYTSYADAAENAAKMKPRYGLAFPAYERGKFYVRIGSFLSRSEAETLLKKEGLAASISSGSSYTVTVTKTKTNEILFEYDDAGATYLAIEPRPTGSEKPQTWFKGYRYYGGFEYDRSADLSSGKINVINVVDMEDYLKGVITFEMSPSWPAEALKAQAVCARTYALNQHKHDSRNFDVCSTTNCQVYRGTASSAGASDAAVDATAGLEIYYNGKIIEASYYSSNGGASENSENVWYTALPYMRGKLDPYESLIKIPNYAYEKTYAAAEVSQILQKKGHSIGMVDSISAEYTATGNMYAMTFTDITGKTVSVRKENCKLLFSLPSMRFTVSGSDHTTGSDSRPNPSFGNIFVNGLGSKFNSVKSLCTISGNGLITKLDRDQVYVMTADGVELLSTPVSQGEHGSIPDNNHNNNAQSKGSSFTFRGTGNGHNVGMSQYGAYAMAQQGLSFRDILNFYYTDITIE